MFNTLGDVVTCALATVAVVVVPVAIARAWWPEVKRAVGNVIYAVVDLFIMSADRGNTPRAADTTAVHVLVPSTDTSAGTTAIEDDITDDYEMPRIGRRLSDTEIITLLALQKGEDGAKYRFSANQIYELVKGPRAERMAQIREVREGPPAPQVREHQARLEALAAAADDD